MRNILLILILACTALLPATPSAQTAVFETAAVIATGPLPEPPDSIAPDAIGALEPLMSKPAHISIYELDYSLTGKSYNWPRLWTNTAVLTGAFVGTLVVLECLPEDATTWNRAALQTVPFYKRWFKNVFKRGPEIDHDNPIFNFVLHPYAGAAYFMSARSCGFNFYQSLLYATIISNVGWEFGVEACMERPSIQDLLITPLVGSAIGELFYKAKRHIASNGYRLWGSPVLGNIVAFLIDPVNEFVGYFAGNDARHIGAAKRPAVTSSLTPVVTGRSFALTLTCTF